MMQVEWDKVIPILVGVFGLFIAAASFYLNRRDKRRKIKVKVSNGFLTSGSELSSLMLMVEAINPGETTVTITGGGLLLSDGRTIPLPGPANSALPQSDVRFPHELSGGKNCQVWIEVQPLAQALKTEGFTGKINIRGFFRDALGTRYLSKRWKFNIDEWIKSQL